MPILFIVLMERDSIVLMEDEWNGNGTLNGVSMDLN